MKNKIQLSNNLQLRLRKLKKSDGLMTFNKGKWYITIDENLNLVRQISTFFHEFIHYIFSSGELLADEEKKLLMVEEKVKKGIEFLIKKALFG